MTDRVLVPMDGSPLSKRALRVALEEHPDATVQVLHVIDPTEPGYSYPLDVDTTREPLHGSEEWMAKAEALAEELFEEVRAMAREQGCECNCETVVGQASRVIIEYAETQDVDRIVMGSHGRDEETRVLLGSVTESVAFRSPVSVLLVR